MASNQPTTLESAAGLWARIVEFADAQAAEAGEGNSGEFSDATEAAELEAQSAEAEDRLIESFAELTGWRPLRVPGTPETDWQDSWDLRPEPAVQVTVSAERKD